ncbi:MAG: aminoacyl-tRNA hydrolase [Candidatus Pacebacteria bacterium]|nr:aminoacyl-tRNA hydrolase [Candidatus Paceibacterota bacterium]
MKIIIGLGNPGEKYKYSRHNLGFLALDWLYPETSWQYSKKFEALVANEDNLILVKPQTFMNNSGLTALKILNYYKLLKKNFKVFTKKDNDLKETLYIIHDDLDINIGEAKISINSSSAGHRGVSSIINHIKTQNFTRIRVGIKSEAKPEKMPTSSFVLQNLNRDELNLARQAFLKKWAEAINSFDI